MLIKRLNTRLQIAITASLILHMAFLSQFSLRRFGKAGSGMQNAITDVEYIHALAQPVGLKPKKPPQPKPKETVNLHPQASAAENAVADEEPGEPEDEDTGMSGNDFGGQGGLFLPFYAVEEIPVFQTRIMPQYPQNAQKLGQTADVLLEAYIDTEGIVRMVRIVKSGGEVFDQEAIAALRKSVFKPARVNGKPVPVKILVPYNFSLEA